MKKIITILLSVILLLFVTSCNSIKAEDFLELLEFEESVTKDFDLPNKLKLEEKEATVTYESNNAAISIANYKAIVIRSDKDIKVNLKATVAYNNDKASKEFEITVLKNVSVIEDETVGTKIGNHVTIIEEIEAKSIEGWTWHRETAATGVEQALTKYGDAIDIILSNNDGMALGVLANKTYQDHAIPLFGVDALDDAIKAVKDGTLAGTIKNDSYTQAKAVIQGALNLINGKEITDGMSDESIPGIYTDESGKVILEEGTKALRVHHQQITKANVDKQVKHEEIFSNRIGDTESKINMFALTYSNSDPDMSGLWKPGFNDFGKELGVKVDWTDANNEDEKAIAAITAATEKNYDAYLINPVDNTNGTAYINAIREKDKDAPIIIWNRELPKEQMTDPNTYYVGFESAEFGRLQGAMAGQFILDNGGMEKFDRNKDGYIGVVILKGENGHPDAESRTLYAPQFLASTIDEVLKVKK